MRMLLISLPMLVILMNILLIEEVSAYECVSFQDAKVIQHPITSPSGEPEILCVVWEGQLTPSEIPASTEVNIAQNPLTVKYEHKFKFTSQGTLILKTPEGTQMKIEVVDLVEKTRTRELQTMIEERNKIIEGQAKQIKNLTFAIHDMQQQLANVTNLYLLDEDFIVKNLTRRDCVQMTDEQARIYGRMVAKEATSPWKDRIAYIGWVFVVGFAVYSLYRHSSDMARGG